MGRQREINITFVLEISSRMGISHLAMGTIIENRIFILFLSKRWSKQDIEEVFARCLSFEKGMQQQTQVGLTALLACKTKLIVLEFHGLEESILTIALQSLQSQGRASLFSVDGSAGVKFS